MSDPMLAIFDREIAALEAKLEAQRAAAAAAKVVVPASATASVFAPLLKPARYKAAHGGRGSGKSHFFVGLGIRRCLLNPPTSIVYIREVQRVLAQSSKRLVETQIERLGVGQHFEVLHDRIKTPGGGLMIFSGMQDHTAESIKSLEGYDIAAVDEAQALSARSLQLLRPTIRKPGSEIWFSWNPRRKADAVDDFFRTRRPDDAIIVQANWRDNPWFPAVLEQERQRDLELYPDRYEHIWEGGYARAFEGAYFSGLLQQARQQGRIGRVAAEPTVSVRAFFDLGGAGAKADAMAIWICQFVGREVRVLDYIEGIGQVLGYYVHELKRRGWGKVLCTLPHDGAHHNWATGKRWADHLYDAGFETDVVPNAGTGAAALEIEAIRRILPRCWFNESTTEHGRDALSFYHEKKDETRSVGLGPEHDWSSHAARAFGLMAVSYEEPRTTIRGDDSPGRRGSHWAA
jgi:phage terminase large subunit